MTVVTKDTDTDMLHLVLNNNLADYAESQHSILEICMGTGMVGVPLNLWEIHTNGYENTAGMELRQRGDGTKTCGNTMGMKFIAAGNPWLFGKHATIPFLVKNS